VVTLKRVKNILKYGLGEQAYEKKRADKQRARLAKFHSERWQTAEDFTQRRYPSYEEYVAHQASKLDKVSGRLDENEAMLFEEFVKRLSVCAQLKPMRSVLCLGARVGTEVRALIHLGHFAVGIDLNPGKDNAYVLPGDFHNLVFGDDTIDAIYTNSLDHVFDLGRLLGEVRRVLRPGGIFIAELLAGFEEGFTPGEYEATHWRTVDAMVERMSAEGDLAVVASTPLGRQWRGEYTQVVFAKPDAG
jgi:SAM-dependent methyltransferase